MAAQQSLLGNEVQNPADHYVLILFLSSELVYLLTTLLKKEPSYLQIMLSLNKSLISQLQREQSQNWK